MDFVLNILLGILFEIIFITLMIIKVKDIKDKKVKLFFNVLISYIASGLLVNFDTSYINQYIVYIVLSVLIYTGNKIIYKDKRNIIDLFFIYYIIMIINYTSLTSIKILNYNYLSMYLSRIILIIILFFSKEINKLYKITNKNWNRHKDNKIKSITLRNVFIIIANISLLIINYFLINYLSILSS